MAKAKLLFEDKEFKLLKTSRDYVVVRKNFPYQFHSHFNNHTGAMFIIKMFYRRVIPTEPYFATALERITTRKELDKFTKHKPKQMFFNVNKKGAKKYRGRR